MKRHEPRQHKGIPRKPDDWPQRVPISCSSIKGLSGPDLGEQKHRIGVRGGSSAIRVSSSMLMLHGS